jgi:hypothetical protein
MLTLEGPSCSLSQARENEISKVSTRNPQLYRGIAHTDDIGTDSCSNVKAREIDRSQCALAWTKNACSWTSCAFRDVYARRLRHVYKDERFGDGAARARAPQV